MRSGLERLTTHCDIPPSEVELLQKIIDLVIDLQPHPSDAVGVIDRQAVPTNRAEAINRVRQIHELLIDRRASAITLMLSSIAVDSTTQNHPVAEADVDGAIGGACLGFEIGGPWGALVGGIVGGAAKSIAAALS